MTLMLHFHAYMTRADFVGKQHLLGALFCHKEAVCRRARQDLQLKHERRFLLLPSSLPSGAGAAGGRVAAQVRAAILALVFLLLNGLSSVEELESARLAACIIWKSVLCDS